MRSKNLVFAMLGAAVLPGCLVASGRSGGHVSVSSTVEVERTYTYFPSHHAYYYEASDEWWVMDGGVWVFSRTRPRLLVITRETPWVVVNVRGEHPHVRYTEHARAYPAGWKPGKAQGPPPGRAWDRKGDDDGPGADDRGGDADGRRGDRPGRSDGKDGNDDGPPGKDRKPDGEAKPDKGEEPDRDGEADKDGRPEKGEKRDKDERPEKGERPDRSGRPS